MVTQVAKISELVGDVPNNRLFTDDSGNLLVALSGVGSGSDRELVVSTYRCKTAFTGASIGDTITATQIIDVSGTPSTVITIWRNQTTAADLAGSPAAANLELTGSTALTDAQLRASRVNVEPLGIPGVARQQATTTASANVVLTSTVGRISLFARTSPLRYVVGSTAQTANAATSHYLAAGERIDLDVPSTPNIAVIRASDATSDGAAEITELS